MVTTTTNYGFQKPDVGGDNDVWGGYLNANWDSIDGLLFGKADLTGATFTGNVALPGGGTGSEALTATEIAALIAAISIPVDSVFGRTGAIVADAADYSAFYLGLGGGTVTGQITLPGGGTGLNAATVTDVNAVATDLTTHEGLTNNPHSVTAAQAGAVADADKASQAEAEAGTNNTKWMTPLRTKQAIDALGSSGASEILVVSHDTAFNVNGGASTASVDETRPLNTVIHNGISGVTLSSNTINNLPAGDYLAEGYLHAPENDGIAIWLYNNSDTANLVDLGSAFEGQIQSYGITFSAKFTLAATKNISLRQRVNTGNANGYGFAHGISGHSNRYAVLKLTKVA